MTAWISDIKRFAVHDGDGIRTTVFFKGCPLKCVWCHNPEGISFAPEIAFYENKCIGCGECGKNGFQPSDCLGEARVLYGREVTVEDLLPLLTEDRAFYDHSGGGVTLSGGECLCQAEFCGALLQELKREGIRTAVDTCGYVSRDALDRVLPWTDVFLYDLKAWDEEVHIRCTGKSNRRILENLQYLDAAGAQIEVRIPYVPEYNSHQISGIARVLEPLKSVKRVKVLPYHNYAGSKYAALGMENTLPKTLPTEEETEAARQVLREILTVEVL